MELQNQTRYPAGLFRTVQSEHLLLAAALVRVTYDIRGDGIHPSEAQPWRVSAGPWACEYGPMDPDESIVKGGTDVFAFGAAVAPAKPVDMMNVSIAVGARHRHRLIIMGDRFWERHWRKLRPTPARAFQRMPLVLANAYGGKDIWDKLEMPFPSNPGGKGYVFAKETAEGKPLPNIEDPRRPITSWRDNPDPMGTGIAGMMFGPKLPSVVDVDPKSQRVRGIRPLLYNTAFPDMIVPVVRPGDAVVVEGMSAQGPLRFAVPEPPVKLMVRFGEKRDTVPVRVDQIGIEPDKSRVFVAWRFPFRYRMNPMQLREARLTSSL